MSGKLEYEVESYPGRASLTAAIVGGTLFLAACLIGVAIWSGLRNPGRWMPRQDPHIELLVFTRLDANQPPIRLSGFTFQAIGEQMFPEFRSVAESPADSSKTQPPPNATWDVSIVLSDGQRFSVVARDLPQGDEWIARGVARPVRGDIELLLAARHGLAMLERSNAADFAATEKAVAALDDEEIDKLLALLRGSNDTWQRGAALWALNYVISPRLRREQRMRGVVFNPSDKASDVLAADHPRGAEVRAAALAVFDEWNQDPSARTTWAWLDQAMFESLRELADPTVADHLATALQKRFPAEYQADEIMVALEQCYALPPLVQPLYFCPTGESKESIARAAVQAQVRRNERRQLLLSWHEKYRVLNRDQQLTAAMPHWESIIAQDKSCDLAKHPHQSAGTFRPLLREGPAIVPFLRTCQQKLPDLRSKAGYEMAIALATGEHDPQFVSELAASDPFDREMADKLREVSSPRTPESPSITE